MAFNSHALKLRLMEGWKLTVGFEQRSRQYTAKATRDDVSVEKFAATLDEAVAFATLEAASAVASLANKKA